MGEWGLLATLDVRQMKEFCHSLKEIKFSEAVKRHLRD